MFLRTVLLSTLVAATIQNLDDTLRREVRDKHYAEAETLLADPAVDIDGIDRDGWTALMYAARGKMPEMVSLLVRAGAKLDVQNEDGETALIIAVKEGRVEAARQLLMAGAKLDLRDQKGRTALDWAVERKKTYLAQIIHIASEPSVARVIVTEKPVLLGSEHLEPPKVIDELPPLYTEDAFERRVEGRVVLKVIIRKDGTVGPIRVHESLEPGLDSAAIEAVKKWTFEPATVDGEPINVLADVEIAFSIHVQHGG
jgi:TonB family protein